MSLTHPHERRHGYFRRYILFFTEIEKDIFLKRLNEKNRGGSGVPRVAIETPAGAPKHSHITLGLGCGSKVSISILPNLLGSLVKRGRSHKGPTELGQGSHFTLTNRLLLTTCQRVRDPLMYPCHPAHTRTHTHARHLTHARTHTPTDTHKWTRTH